MRKVLFLAVLLLSVIGVFAQNTSKNCYRGYVDAGYLTIALYRYQA